MSLGSMISKARVDARLSIEDLSASTNIRIPVIREMETNSQLFALEALITTSTPVPVERVASPEGDASGVAAAVAVGVTLLTGFGISDDEVLETII